MYTVSFRFDDNGQTYTTKPMNADMTISFMADAAFQAFDVVQVTKLVRRRQAVPDGVFNPIHGG